MESELGTFLSFLCLMFVSDENENNSGPVSPNPFHQAKLAVVGEKTNFGTTRISPVTKGAKKRRMVELSHRLLNSKGTKVVEKIIQIALDDKHPGQMQALKLCVERIAPVSFFEGVHKAQQNNQINIKVTVSDPRSIPEVKVVEGEVVDADS